MLSLSGICRSSLKSVLQKCPRKVNVQAVRAVQTKTETKYGRNFFWGSVIAGSLGTGLFLFYNHDPLHALQRWTPAAPSPPSHPSHPLYSREDVAKHKSPESGIWVTYEGHVYDITEFVGYHPGGDKILLAAGGALEPFWAMYAVHQTDEVMKMLEKYHIGELKVKFNETFLKQLLPP